MSLPTSSTTRVAAQAGIRIASACSSSRNIGEPSSSHRNRTRYQPTCLPSLSTASSAVGMRTHARPSGGNSSGRGAR